MKKYLKRLPKEIQGLLHLAADTASLRGMPAYLVGGFVRDLILGVNNLDLDIVIEGDGIQFAQDLAAALNGRLIRHSRFGTATVIPGHHLKVDIATARNETYPEPAALPVVEFGSLKDDLARRDFTINAMAIDITGRNFGELIDFFGGKQDLADKKIRILHELSFIDDPTRILRAIRFERRYDFKIEPGTLKCLKDAARNEMLERVQPQRLRDELILVLKEKNPLKQVKRIQELTGFGFISRNLSLSKKVYALFSSAQKEIDWFNKLHDRRRKLDIWLIYFMALLEPVGINEVKRACERFVFRKGEEKRILCFKKIGAGFIAKLKKKNITPSGIFNLLSPLSYEVILLLKAKYRNPLVKKHIEEFLEVYNDIRISLSGHDLHRLGIAPGPSYQRLFAKVLKAKLNGAVKSESEELSLIKKLIKNNPGA